MENCKFEKLSENIFVCAGENHRFGTDAFLLADFSEYKKMILYATSAQAAE